MEQWQDKPAANPVGQALTVDQVQIERTAPMAAEPVEAIKFAIEVVKQNPAETIGYSLAVIAIQFVISMLFSVVNVVVTFAGGMLSGMLAESSPALGSAVMFGAQGVGQMFSIAVGGILAGLMLGCLGIIWLRLLRGQTLSLSDLGVLKDKGMIVPLMAAGLLNQVVITLGFFMFVIPGIILSLGLLMYGYIVVDKNLGPIDALKASWQLTNGHKISLLLLGFLCGVLNLVGAIPCGLGLIATVPITMGAMIFYYDRIAEPGNAYLHPGEPTGDGGFNAGSGQGFGGPAF